ncbi:MAG: RadC family protein [Oscillospiraceae bacterium]
MADDTHKGHRQRVKERFKKDMNFDNFAEHEILEMLLFYCIPQHNTNDIAHNLLNKFGSLSNVLSASPEDLINSKIISENTAVSLKFFNSLNIYLHLKNNDDEVDFCNIPELKAYIKDTFYGVTFEQFKIYFTDNSYKVKSYMDISTGSDKSVELNLREITKAVLNNGSSYFFVAHNHPDAPAAPSDEDIYLTRKIITHLRSMDIHLLDHFIVGNDGIISMRQSGLIYDHEC